MLFGGGRDEGDRIVTDAGVSLPKAPGFQGRNHPSYDAGAWYGLGFCVDEAGHITAVI